MWNKKKYLRIYYFIKHKLVMKCLIQNKPLMHINADITVKQSRTKDSFLLPPFFLQLLLTLNQAKRIVLKWLPKACCRNRTKPAARSVSCRQQIMHYWTRSSPFPPNAPSLNGFKDAEARRIFHTLQGVNRLGRSNRKLAGVPRSFSCKFSFV